jgi:hypothetical protein
MFCKHTKQTSRGSENLRATASKLFVTESSTLRTDNFFKIWGILKKFTVEVRYC